MVVDPVIVRIATAAVAIVFLVGAWQKLRDLMAFELAIDAYELVPAPVVKPIALLLPLLEAAAALLLVIDATRVPGVILASAVLGVVTSAVAINLLRGRTDVGCGCGGLEDEQLLSWSLVTRNLLLLGVILSTLLPSAARALNWFDAISIGAGAVILYGVYVIASQLIANQPRLLRLRHAA